MNETTTFANTTEVNTPDLAFLASGYLPAGFRALQDNIIRLNLNPELLRQALEALSSEERERFQALQAKFSALQQDLPSDIRLLDKIVQTAQRLDFKLVTPEVPPAYDPKRFERAPYPILHSDIGIVVKLSKVERDMIQLDIGVEQLREKYRNDGEDADDIIASHFRQIEAREMLQNAFPSEQFVLWHFGVNDSEMEALVHKSKLVVSCGGDNHFQAITQHLLDDKPLLGLTSDPVRSHGALLPLNVPAFFPFLKKLEQADYQFSPWTRLRASLNGVDVGPACCEVFMGEERRPDMSGHFLTVDGKSYKQKSSGLLIVSGAGSTGWYRSASHFLYPKGNAFSPEARYARFVNTEISATGETDMMHGILLEGSKIQVKSRNDAHGILTRDCVDSPPFPRGMVAEISIDPAPLWVIGKSAA